GSGTQIQYRERGPLEEGNALQNLHSNIQSGTDTIQGEGTTERRESCPAEEREPLGEGNPARAYTLICRGTQIQYRERKPILPCRAYTLIYRGILIQYRERGPFEEGDPALQSLHSNIQMDTDTIQGEGTIGRRESCTAELTL
ncbi:hypothetical protein XELAEV_18021634mg, partial [Xenopus laevis]